MANISDIVNSKTNQVELQATRTNWVDNSVVSVTNNNGGTVSSNTKFRCYRDNNDLYTLEYIIDITGASSTGTHIVTLGLGVNFSGETAGTGSGGGIAGMSIFAQANTQDIYQASTTSTSSVRVSGFATLAGQPSWWDDNLMTSSGLPIATADTYGVVKATDWEAWTPITNITNSTATGLKKREGDTMHYKVLITYSGSPAAANQEITLDETIDTTKILDTTSDIDMTLGIVSYVDAGTTKGVGRVAYYSSTSVRMWQNNTIFDRTNPITWAVNDKVFLSFSVPIV